MEQAERQVAIGRQYDSLLCRIDSQNTTGLGEELFQVLSGWEHEIAGRWGDQLFLCFDREEWSTDDVKAAEFVLTLPKHLHRMAILCGQCGAGEQASAIMRLKEQLLSMREKAQG